jgi:hypothetical protein
MGANDEEIKRVSLPLLLQRLNSHDQPAPVLLGRNGNAAGQNEFPAKQAVRRMTLDLAFGRTAGRLRFGPGHRSVRTKVSCWLLREAEGGPDGPGRWLGGPRNA